MGSTRLFNLIKTMNRGEKRAYKLFASRYKNADNQYNRLFEVIDGLNEYDDKKVKSAFSEPKLSKQLPVLKSQLFNMVVGGLRAYSESKFDIFKVSKNIESAELLFKRGMVKDAYNLIQKAKSVAYETESYTKLEDILHKEIQLVKRLLDADKLHLEVNKILEEKNQVRRILENEEIYERLYNEIHFLYRTKGFADAHPLQEAYRKIINTPYLQEITQAKTTTAKYNYYVIYAIYFSAVHKSNEALESTKKQVELLEKNERFLADNLDFYLRSLNNLIIIYVSLALYDEALKNIKKLRALPERFTDIGLYFQQRIFEITYSSELSLYIDSLRTKEGVTIVPEIKAGLESFSKTGLSLERYTRICFGVALLFFLDKDYQKSHTWIEKVLFMERKITASYLLGYAKILFMLLHFELGNYLLVDSLAQTTKRYLSNNNRLFEVEQTTIKYLQKLSRTQTELRQGIFEQFLAAIDALNNESSQSYLLGQMRLKRWIQSHLSKQE